MLEELLVVVNIGLILLVVFIEHKNPREVLLWVAILIVLPVLGIILYLIFASTIDIKLAYYIKNKKLDNMYRKHVYEQLNKMKVERVNTENLTQRRMREMIQFNLSYSEGLLTENNRIEQITDGKEKYKRMFRDIDEAQTSIHIQYYGIHNDLVGHALVAHLTQKAKEGIQIKVLFDGMGSLSTPNKMFRPLIEVGGKVKRIRPYLTHYRNHRKIVVIDGKIAYMGGMNIGKQYMNLGKKKKPWRDTQMRVIGDGVFALQYYFLYDWFYANKAETMELTDHQLADLFPSHQVSHFLPCQFVAGGVHTDKEMIKMSYLKMINCAQEKILLQSPYFIPDESILDAFKVAAASGVEIEIMLPQIKPSFFLQPVGDYYIDKLLDYGVKVYKYKGYMHAKTLSIDGVITCIGSVNMDIRSLEIDDEICGFMYDEAFTREHEAIFKKDKENAIELDYEAFRRRGMGRKILERVFRLLEPIM